MMADDRPIPMDLGNVGAYDAKTAQSDSDMSCVRHSLARVQKRQRSRKEEPNGSGTWHHGEGVDEWTSDRRDD